MINTDNHMILYNKTAAITVFCIIILQKIIAAYSQKRVRNVCYSIDDWWNNNLPENLLPPERGLITSNR